MLKSKLRRNRKNPKVHIDASGKVMTKNSKTMINIKIKNRFDAKVEEFEKLNKEELSKLINVKMSTTDMSALAKVLKDKKIDILKNE